MHCLQWLKPEIFRRARFVCRAGNAQEFATRTIICSFNIIVFKCFERYYMRCIKLRGASVNNNIPQPLDAEIENRFQQAGLAIPADLKAGAISEARAALGVTFWLRQPRTAAIEPSNIFSLAKGARS